MAPRGVQKINERGLVHDGVQYDLDVLIYATGFDFMSRESMGRITGADGRSVADKWEEEGTRTFLGVHCHGYPNLFIVAGPQGTGGTFNFTDAIEEHTDYLAWLLTAMRDLGHGVVDIRKEGQDRWAQLCADADLASAPRGRCAPVSTPAMGKTRHWTGTFFPQHDANGTRESRHRRCIRLKMRPADREDSMTTKHLLDPELHPLLELVPAFELDDEQLPLIRDNPGMAVELGDAAARQALSRLPAYDMLGLERSERAASRYRRLRNSGVTVRKTIDVIIGSFCIDEGLPLLFSDRDFLPMVEHLGLQPASAGPG